MQNNGKGKTKKRAALANLLLLIRRKRVMHVQFVFLLIKSISLEAIFKTRNHGQVCFFQTTENEEHFPPKDDNGKLWVPSC